MIFHLYSENTEYKGLLLAGEYKLVIENHIEWMDMDSSIIPVFLQPDYQYLEDFGSTVINNSYHERDIYQLISVKKCEYCDLANGDSTVFGGQFYSEVSFRGSNLSNSNFTRSYFENSIFSSYIDNEIPIYSYGHTNLNNAIFEYCKMNWVMMVQSKK